MRVYDSDGLVGPFYDAVLGEGVLVEDEEEIAIAEDDGPKIVAEVAEDSATPNTVTEPVLTKEIIMGFKVAKL